MLFRPRRRCLWRCSWGFGVGAAGIIKRFPVFVGDYYEGVAFVFDVHGLLWVGGINNDVLAVVEDRDLGAGLRVALGRWTRSA